MRRSSITTACIALLAVLCAAGLPVAAQPVQLRVHDVSAARFPSVGLAVEITHNGAILRSFDRGDFRITENGVEQTIDEITCPGDSVTRLSIALLIDRSGSMAQDPSRRDDPDTAKLRAAKRAVSIFLGFLGSRDEAALYSFSSTVSRPPIVEFFDVNANFTNDTAALRRALVPIVAAGGTRIWQAARRTIDSLALRAGRRVLILLTDGRSQDLDPRYTVGTVIGAALASSVTIHTIGLGDDVNPSDLAQAAQATGGRYQHSPDETQLESIFATIASEIISDACILKYTTSAHCPDGALRRIDVELRAEGRFAEDTASYVPPRALADATLEPVPPGGIPAKTLFVLPILMQDELQLTQQLAYGITLRFDPAVLRFMDVRTDSAISRYAQIRSETIGPGRVRLTALPHFPAFKSGLLLAAEFTSYGRGDTLSTAITIDDAELQQECPAVVRTTAAPFTLLPCAIGYDIGIPARAPIPPGDILIPIRVHPAIQPGTDVSLSFNVEYDPGLIVCSGIDDAHTLAAQITTVSDAPPGVLRIAMQGVATDSTAILCNIRFSVPARRDATLIPLRIRDAAFGTECATSLLTHDGVLPVDGLCERILERHVDAPFIASHPNPFNPSTVVEFGIPASVLAQLTVHDLTGREVARLAAGAFDAGIWRTTFHAAGLPAGVYYLRLATPSGTVIHSIILQK